MAENMEDDDNFNLFPGGKSRLSNLFPTQHTDEGDVNQSLTYVAPKQPKRSGDGQQQSSTENLKLIHVIAAYTYKLEGGQYKTQGRFGVAILGDNEKRVYKLLLYKGKHQTITISTIQPDFKFTVELNNYAKFPDDKGDQWSITFNSEAELIDFAKQIALAKANGFGKNLSTLIMQDLLAGDGAIAEIGDTLEISFTGSLFKKFSFGKVFDNSAEKGKRTSVESGKTNILKGWNEGLSGAKKGLRRLLVMPSSFGYDVGDLPDLVTPDDIVIFEVFIHKIRRSADRSRSPSASKSRVEKKPDVPPRTYSVSNDDIRTRGASLSEQLTQSPRKDNAQLISRIAKIGGTNILGQNPTAVQTSSESEPEKEIEQEPPRSTKHSGASPKHILEKKSEYNENTVFKSQRSISSPSNATPVIQNTVIPYATPPPPHASSESFQFVPQPYIGLPHMIPSLMPSAVPSLMENHLPLLVAETRTQNTEMRMTIGKLSDKVDTVIQKIDDIRLSQGNLRTQGPIPYMESVVLAQNIERVIQENIQMKRDMEIKNSKIQELNEKVCDVLQRNQGFFEESNSILERRSDKLSSTSAQFESRIQNLELEKAKLSSELKESISNTNDTQFQLHELQKQVQELQEKLGTSEARNVMQKEVIQNLEDQNKENENSIRTLRHMIEDVNQEKQHLVSKLQSSENKFIEAENIMERLESKVAKQSSDLQMETKEEVKTLRENLQKALEYKKKFEILYENTRQLKAKYELRISQLQAENAKKSKTDASLQPSSFNFPTEIRKTMNKLYKFLQSEIEKERVYSGTEVLDVCLNVIKRTTFTILGKGQMQGDDARDQSQSERSVKENSQFQGNSTEKSRSEGNSEESEGLKQCDKDSQLKQTSKNGSQFQQNSSDDTNFQTQVVDHSSQSDKTEREESTYVQDPLERSSSNVQGEEPSVFSSGDQSVITKVEDCPVAETPSSAGENITHSSESELSLEGEPEPETRAQFSSSKVSTLGSSIGDTKSGLKAQERVSGKIKEPITESEVSDVPIYVNDVAHSIKEDISAELEKVEESGAVKKSEEPPKLEKFAPVDQFGGQTCGCIPHIHHNKQNRRIFGVVLITLLFSVLLYIGSLVDGLETPTISSTTF